ncbi:hypothetical protein BDU57DRAFT_553151 [Ampelomyces quisqualis]|uniref:Aminoglycoside phosphotransferase domain-containing protein n=1 Tax=Ampelomyces quisqualis TaxID=50730 RepID=A0A6A5R060_AMPQU|nr:hypothetical protein BDU57DRAFT_553151 [Ampelomyces quisqualis]
MTYKFLRDKATSNILLVQEMYSFGGEGEKFFFIVMSRAKGVTLESVWAKLNQEEKRSYTDQMITALRELRQFTASLPQRVDGSPLQDNIIGQCWPSKMCKALYNEIPTTFPDSAPFVLTHADPNIGNIIVHDGNTLAIINWEHAGYYPCALSGNGRELFHMVWAEVNPQLSLHEFVEKAYRPAQKAAAAHQFAPIEHTHIHDVWLRPRWCECKPYAGTCTGKEMSAELRAEA